MSSGTPPSKLYSVVKLVRSTPGMCFGMIGGGNSFCFRMDCKVKAHLEHKFAFQASDPEVVVIIQRPAPLTAFREPRVAWEVIPASMWKDWEGKMMNLAE